MDVCRISLCNMSIKLKILPVVPNNIIGGSVQMSIAIDVLYVAVSRTNIAGSLSVPFVALKYCVVTLIQVVES